MFRSWLATPPTPAPTSSNSNSITADTVSAGALNIAGTALENARGMVNVTANTGPNSVVQGTLSLTVILND